MNSLYTPEILNNLFRTEDYVPIGTLIGEITYLGSVRFPERATHKRHDLWECSCGSITHMRISKITTFGKCHYCVHTEKDQLTLAGLLNSK